LSLVVALGATSPPEGKPGIRFEEIAGKAGLNFVTDSSPTSNKNQVETMVAGLALLDYDNDGFLDLYVVNGAAIPSLKKESQVYWNRLFHNNHDGTFTDVTGKSGVAGAGFGMGVAVGDYDNDGWPDLFVANVTANQLFHNNHDGTFTDLSEKAGLQGATLDGRKMWSVGAGWFDYNNDSLLDSFVVNYCKWEVDMDPVCTVGGAVRAYCHPQYYSPTHNSLYRNNGDGTFTDVRKTQVLAGSSEKV
jgi:enediyne biosynthesis protein E4